MSVEEINENKIKLITAAMEMIGQSGIHSVTARSLGNSVDMNSALIYRYFKDIDEVVLFACVNILQRYTVEMQKAVAAASEGNHEISDEEMYLMSWELFSKHAFSYPEEYTMLFFSKHSNNLQTIIKTYFELFPEELGSRNDVILDSMFHTSNIRNRNLILLIPVLEGKLPESKIMLLNDMTIAFFYSLLVQLSDPNNDSTPEHQAKRMLEACRFTIGL